MLGLFWGERSGQGSRGVSVRRGERRHAAVRRGHRPAIEGLEERIALATDVWTGGAGVNWTTAGNWSPAVTPSAGDDLVFPGSASNFNSNNDFPSGTAFGSISIQASGYNLSGNNVSLSNGITASYGTGTSTDSIPTALTAVVAPISVSTGGTLDLAGALSGPAGVNVSGGGTLDLSAVNTYTGPTTLGSGTRLVVNGTIAGVQNNGGLLAGNGSVGGVNSIGGNLLPGLPATALSPQPAPGQLTAGGSVSLGGGSGFGAVLDGTSPGNGVTGYSQLVVSTGSISLGQATLTAVLGTSYTPTVGDQLTIIQNNTGSSINGNFAGLAEGGALTVGSSLFRISYLGTNGSGDSVVLTAVAGTTSTTLQPVQIPSNPSQPFTISAQVSGTLGTPTGTVQFYNGNPASGGTLLASAPVTPLNGATGLASATVSSLGATTSPVLYALYIPTPASTTYSGSTSAPVNFTTATTLTSSSSTGLVGQAITFTATVTPATANAGTPTGSVQFIADKTTVLGTVPLNATTGQASLTVSTLSIGTHSITAQFIANAPFQNSTSSALTQSISTAGVTPIITLVPIVNPHGKVGRFEIVVTVRPTVEVGVVPIGNVTYFINGRNFYQTVPLTNGTATIFRPWSRLMNHTIYARYNGSGTFVAASSSSFYLSHRELTLIARNARSGGRSLARIRERSAQSPRG